MMHVSKNLEQIASNQKEIAGKNEVERICKACQDDFDKRAAALSAWNGLGYAPVKVPLHYICIPSKQVVQAVCIGGNEQILELTEGVPIFELSKALKEKGWDSQFKDGESCYILV